VIQRKIFINNKKLEADQLKFLSDMISEKCENKENGKKIKEIIKSRMKSDKLHLNYGALEEVIYAAISYFIWLERGGMPTSRAPKSTQYMSDDDFIKYFTLLPGIKYSKVAQEFKASNGGEYDKLKSKYKREYLNCMKWFLIAEEKSEAADEALKHLDVMHPKNKAEATLIRKLDEKNTELNEEIAKKVSAGVSYESEGEEQRIKEGKAQSVEVEGGIVGNHALAFSQMLRKREASPVLIRPAGKHATGYLKESYPAKPLWVKGKSIDTSKFSAEQFGYLRDILISQNKEERDARQFIKKLKEGYIPTDQIYSKWLRGVDYQAIEKYFKKIHKPNTVAEQVLEMVKVTNQAIEEMLETGLVKKSVEYGVGYVSDPATGKAYTGDYDLYSVSHAESDVGKLKEINHLRGNSRRDNKGAYNDDNLQKLKIDAYKPYAQQETDIPEPAKVHKLFGNISRFEMGMKIDLNSAAIIWGGYEGGQVIKHGAEARNFQFPQEISDGIVTVEKESSNFDKKAVDEKDKGYINLSLLEQARELKGKDVNLPLNVKLEAFKNWLTVIP